MTLPALHLPVSELSLFWLEPGDDLSDVVHQREAIYGMELGWLGAVREFTEDAYDSHSSTLVAYRSGRLCASSRLSVETRGPLELSDLVDWKPPSLEHLVAAEWSRVMIDPELRQSGLFRAMYVLMRKAARARGASIVAGASVKRLQPLYERLGFAYLDRPFRCPSFAESPIYYPAYQVLG